MVSIAYYRASVGSMSSMLKCVPAECASSLLFWLGKLQFYARFSIKVQLVCVLTFYNYKCMLTITDIWQHFQIYVLFGEWNKQNYNNLFWFMLRNQIGSFTGNRYKSYPSISFEYVVKYKMALIQKKILNVRQSFCLEAADPLASIVFSLPFFGSQSAC